VSRAYLHWVEPLTNECQSFEGQFPHLIFDLQTVCLEAFQQEHPDNFVTSAFYKARYSHLLQVEVSNPASEFPFAFSPKNIDQIVGQILSLRPELQSFEFTGQHYAIIAEYFMECYLCFGSNK